MYRFSLKTFPNGLRLLIVPSKESLTVQVMVGVNTGADFETKETNGISHFLEHLCFKGTKKRPSNLILTQELDKVGAVYNAFTSDEYTGFFVKTAKENLDLALDFVSDIYLNSLFPEEEIKKEKGVIIEEINMCYDIPQRLIWDFWYQLLYGNQPAGWSTLGTKENIRRFQRQDFLKYYQQQYKAGSTLIVVSGNFSEKEIVSKVKRYFAEIRKGVGKTKQSPKEKQSAPRIFLQNRQTDQTHLIFGVRGFNLFDPRCYALNLLDVVWDGGMSSRLWQTVREKLGAAYYVSSIVYSNTDYGYWGVGMGIDNQRLIEVLKTVLAEWKKFNTQLISPHELKNAKDFLKGRMAVQLENIHDFAENFAFQELLKRKIETPVEYLKKINKLSSRDLQKTANDLLKRQMLNLAIIGPHKNEKSLQKILNSF